jgi:hypothetical protein
LHDAVTWCWLDVREWRLGAVVVGFGWRLHRS